MLFRSAPRPRAAPGSPVRSADNACCRTAGGHGRRSRPAAQGLRWRCGASPEANRKDPMPSAPARAGVRAYGAGGRDRRPGQAVAFRQLEPTEKASIQAILTLKRCRICKGDDHFVHVLHVSLDTCTHKSYTPAVDGDPTHPDGPMTPQLRNRRSPPIEPPGPRSASALLT